MFLFGVSNSKSDAYISSRILIGLEKIMYIGTEHCHDFIFEVELFFMF